MCLEYIRTPKDTKEFKNNLVEDADGFVTVYKEVRIRDHELGYFSNFGYQEKAYKAGLNIAKRPFCSAYIFNRGLKKEKYRHGFYFLTESPVRVNPRKVIQCKVKKSWITSVGTDNCYKNVNTIVCKKAIFPEFPQVYKKY